MDGNSTTSPNESSGPGPQSAKLTGTLLTSAVVAALGGLLFGFDTAVISGTLDALKDVFDLNPHSNWLGMSGSFWFGFTVSSALIGTMVGAVLVGKPSDRFGRRAALIVLAVLYLVSALGSALAWDWTSFLIARFIGGLAVGGASVAAPMYIAEISPAKFRGRLVAVAQLNIVTGIVVAFFSNMLIDGMNLGGNDWRWMYGVEAVPAALFFFLLFFTPYSPRWLMSRKRVDEARAVLGKLGTDDGGVEEEIGRIAASLDLEHHSAKEPLFRKVYFRPIMLAMVIAAFNQLSGINAILYYAPTVFGMAGVGKHAALVQAVGMGMTNLVFTIIALLVIDHFGRKKLMIVGAIGYILSLGATTWAFHTYADDFAASAHAATFNQRAKQVAETVETGKELDIIQRETAKNIGDAADADKPDPMEIVVSDVITALQAADRNGAAEAVARAKSLAKEADAAVDKDRVKTGSTVVLVGMLVFIISHAVGQGAVIWVFVSEIFPNRIRARGQALASFTLWLVNALITWIFPVVAAMSPTYIFAFFTGMMTLQLFWVLLVMPETKGVPLEEIQKKLGIE